MVAGHHGGFLAFARPADRLIAGKRSVLMLSHDVSFGSGCCKPVTIFKSLGNSGECEDVLLTRRAANKEVQYDALVKSQQERGRRDDS